jgi:hypothetical protein
MTKKACIVENDACDGDGLLPVTIVTDQAGFKQNITGNGPYSQLTNMDSPVINKWNISRADE